MAWNQPDPQKSPWGRRPAGARTDLESRLREWQRRLLQMLRSSPQPARARSWIVALAIAGLALGWLATGFYQIASAERGLILRFGAFHAVVQEGMGWHLPWPIDTLRKVNVMSVRSQDFRPQVLTSDLNLIDVHFSVQYRLVDPLKVLFQVRDPEGTLGEISQSAVGEVVGQSPLQDVLAGVTRPRVTQRIQELIQRVLDSYGSGIAVSSVNLTDVQVPEPVIPAQRDANQALADEEGFVKQAQAYANRVVPEAQGRAAGLQQDALGYRTRVVDIANGQASRFLDIAAAYQRAPAVTRERLYLETMENVLSRASTVIVDTKPGPGGNVIYLPLDRLAARPAPAQVPGASLPAGPPSVAPVPPAADGGSEREPDAGRQSGRTRSGR